MSKPPWGTLELQHVWVIMSAGFPQNEVSGQDWRVFLIIYMRVPYPSLEQGIEQHNKDKTQLN